ncbi:MAG: GTP 3',8-cyclase MoaA [Alphaproteobacteria bacterium]|nr:GTP 3',8-cyclase MoaA [Alphaproteobacteria bacterium]
MLGDRKTHAPADGGAGAPAPAPLIDGFARPITYLRVSVTDRCDLRCVYCMAEDMVFLPKAEVLTLEEMDRLVSAFIRLGVRKVRITGGEPLVRQGILSLFQSLGRHLRNRAIDELTLTTNATQLSRYADGLYEAGVRRVNVSLDTLDPAKFTVITRRGDIAQVFDGLDAAKAAGLKVKINMVALRDHNADDIDDMLAWCGEQGFDLTLIEVMPMGDIGGPMRLDQYLPLSLVRGQLARKWTLEESDHETGGPARYVTVKQTGRRLGFITPMTHNFCESCNRVRLTCTGSLYMCLGQDDRADLRGVLRRGGDGAELDKAITDAIGIKPKSHDFVIGREVGADGRTRETAPAVARHMSVTGG